MLRVVELLEGGSQSQDGNRVGRHTAMPGVGGGHSQEGHCEDANKEAVQCGAEISRVLNYSKRQCQLCKQSFNLSEVLTSSSKLVHCDL